MQEICSKTGGGVGPDPLETITPEEMEARVAAQLLDGEGSMLVRPTPQPFAITTKKNNARWAVPFYYVKLFILQVLKQNKCDIIIR